MPEWHPRSHRDARWSSSINEGFRAFLASLGLYVLRATQRECNLLVVVQRGAKFEAEVLGAGLTQGQTETTMQGRRSCGVFAPESFKKMGEVCRGKVVVRVGDQEAPALAGAFDAKPNRAIDGTVRDGVRQEVDEDGA